MGIQRIDLECSNKDIPTPSRDQIKKMLVRRTFEHIVRLRWKILAHLYPEKFGKAGKETYGFRSNKFPRKVQCEALAGFEKELWTVIKSVEFRPFHSHYQTKLKECQDKVRNPKHIIVESDKTGNHYEVDSATYKQLLENEVSKDFKKVRSNK